MLGLHPNWRILAVGTILAAIGKWGYDAAVNSPFLTTNLPAIANALKGGIVVFQGMVVLGLTIAVFGLFWGRWLWAIFLGAGLALLVFFVSFAP